MRSHAGAIHRSQMGRPPGTDRRATIFHRFCRRVEDKSYQIRDAAPTRGAIRALHATELSLAHVRRACENSSAMNSVPIFLSGAGAATAAGVFAWGAVAPSAQLFGPTLRRTGNCGTLALTFDDGPNPAITPALLKLLEHYDARATFFQIGERVRAFPALSKDVAQRGHSLGNHTDTHSRLTFLSPGRIRDELARCNDALAAATGQTLRWMRPPYGFRGPQLESAMRRQDENARVVMWSISGRDWKLQTEERTIKRLRRVRGGDIVLLHDGDHRTPQGDRHNTVAALKYWLPRWKDAGIRLVSLDEAAQAGFAG
jgi:peptidoglycan/xylan/chitin deacetylase (PgdA/CDA1 family)